MGKGLIFFCCACTILLFTIINLSVGPVISGKLGSWGYFNCAPYKEAYDLAKDSIDGDPLKYGPKFQLDYCNNHKGMYNMEYTAFIFDIVIGFVCGLLGLLNYYAPKPDFVPKLGLIGLGCGIVGFVLTFVYIILNGIIYTTPYYSYSFDLYPNDPNFPGIIKRDSDGVAAEKDGNECKCLYYDSENNFHSLFATYSDLIQKQYNYNKDLNEKYAKVGLCTFPGIAACITGKGKIPCGTCDKLYASPISGIENKDLSDRFLTTLLLGLFVCLANIGLAIFGFLIFRSGEF